MQKCSCSEEKDTAVTRVFVPLTWFQYESAVRKSAWREDLPSQPLYVLLCKLHTFLHLKGVDPQGLVSTYNPGVLSAVCRNR